MHLINLTESNMDKPTLELPPVELVDFITKWDYH
jgi:hypothetical protein